MGLVDIPLQNRIFCNRSLNMDSIKSIGFDMDYTLVLYQRYAFETLVYDEMTKKMVADGYPSEMLSWTFDPTTMIRGLLIDKKRGNILKLDRHNYVKIARHGFRELTQQERRTFYDIDKPLLFKEPDFSFLDTFFLLSKAFLFSKLVDYKDRTGALETKTYEDFYYDILNYFEMSHRDDSIKNIVIKNPDQYIIRDPDILETLNALRQNGKKLFLLTNNSSWDYIDFIMSYSFPMSEQTKFKHWSEYFDIIIMKAFKPEFFSAENDFIPGISEKVFQCGNAQKLHSLLNIPRSSEILYVGDHIYGDVVRSKKNLGWRTMLLIDELKTELNKEYHPIWGSLLKTGQNNSLFSSQVAHYACLYTSKFSNFKHYTAQTKFEAPPDLLPHDRL
jgi:5'-nucleotidase